MAVTSERDDGRDDAEALAAAWTTGDPAALHLTWEALGSLVYTYCYRALNDRDAAGEHTRETFVAAWHAREQFERSAGPLAAWLVGFARERVVDAQRTHLRRPIQSVAAPGGDDDAVQSASHRLADRLLVAHALGELPLWARQAIELAFYSDLSQPGIAERLEVPVASVRNALRLGLERIHDHLGQGWARA